MVAKQKRTSSDWLMNMSYTNQTRQAESEQEVKSRALLDAGNYRYPWGEAKEKSPSAV